MNNESQIKTAIIYASCAALYVAGIGDLMYMGSRAFEGHNDPGPLAPIAILLLFVLSTAVMGLLFFGRPIYLYFEGKKTEAVNLAVLTVSIFSLITISALASLYIFFR